MRILQDTTPHRFRDMDAVNLFVESVKSNKPDYSLSIPCYLKNRINPEYDNAPFEAVIFGSPEQLYLAIIPTKP